MKKKTILIPIISLCILFNPSILHSEDFNSYYQNNYREFQNYNQGFKKYKKTINEEFEAYKKIMEEEFEAYKKQIEKEWKNPIVPSEKVFVEYSKDYKSRKMVDFNNGTIKVEVIKPKNYKKALIKNLANLITEKTKEAFIKNPVLKNTDKRLRLATSGAIAVNRLNNESIIGDVLTGKKI
ncbi:murein transglycosylase domain-containing protein [Desulfurobacterium indicum]|uniref:Murein transglycosylase-C N-terminal domain-containing protein n=1 Tax=Desulfurobacterium indicum TaxID=1914305 RepID=A0A1R1MJY9_9BACT|nr:murein transglycosylase domain-containing protein [Desulfurobacterium indicum]OMH40079.1 hypothetical protein BLW93_07085 [Desulfurobacterium indicum]